MTSKTFTACAQHPNTGQNIQHLWIFNATKIYLLLFCCKHFQDSFNCLAISLSRTRIVLFTQSFNTLLSLSVFPIQLHLRNLLEFGRISLKTKSFELQILIRVRWSKYTTQIMVSGSQWKAMIFAKTCTFVLLMLFSRKVYLKQTYL